MTDKNYVKLALDILMSLTFVLLFNKMVLGGLAFHEIAGLGIGFAMFAHILLNLQWAKKVTLNLFDRKLPGNTRFGYLLNVLLLISMTFIILSGLLISKVVFPNLHIGNQSWFKIAHISFSYLTLILIGIHVGLHWQWIINHMKKIFKVNSSKVTDIIAKAAIALVLLFGGYQMYTTNFATRIEGLGIVFNMTSPQAPPAGVKQHSDGSNSSRGNSEERPSSPDGTSEGRSEGTFQSPHPLGVIATYSGIMGVFIIITYYSEKLRTRKN